MNSPNLTLDHVERSFASTADDGAVGIPHDAEYFTGLHDCLLGEQPNHQPDKQADHQNPANYLGALADTTLLDVMLALDDLLPFDRPVTRGASYDRRAKRHEVSPTHHLVDFALGLNTLAMRASEMRVVS